MEQIKILVIGKTGQLGSVLLKKACESGFSVFGLSREELDITNKNKVEQIVNKYNPSIIINTAAFHNVIDCELYPEIAFQVNAVAVKYLADICRDKKIRLVHYSTDRVFDGDKNFSYTENDRPNPLQVYGISKLAGEQCAQYYNPNTIIIRTCGIFGGREGSRVKKGNFVLYILRQAENKRKLEISSEQIINVVNADDLAKGTLKLLKMKADHGIYNVVNRGFCSWAEFAEQIVKLNHKSLKIIPIDRHGIVNGMKVPKFTVLSTKKIESMGIVLPMWKNALKRYLTFLNSPL